MNISAIQFKSLEQILLKRQQIYPNINALGLPDMCLYFYCKEGGLFSKKQQRAIFHFFQGLNTNPSNISLFLKDFVEKENKNSKQKIVKGIFIVYDIFNKVDCVTDISIPGTLSIYKYVNKKKQIMKNQQIDAMYVSSILRGFWQKNILWGKSYDLFQNQGLHQFETFLKIFLKVVTKKDIFLGQDFQIKSGIKGSNSCSLLFSFIQEKHIIHHAIDYLDKLILHYNYEDCAKIQILCAQLQSLQGKHSKSLERIEKLLEKYEKDPFLLYYQGKYLYKLSLFNQSLIILNSIVQYNQFQVWILLAQVHVQMKKYSQALACLNQASKLTKFKNTKNIDNFFRQFQECGKIIPLTSFQSIDKHPRLHCESDSPSNIPLNQVQEKFRFLIQKPYWKLNSGDKKIYEVLRQIRYSLDPKRFQQLLEATFNQTNKKYIPVQFKNGMTQSMFMDVTSNVFKLAKQENNDELSEQIPTFLKEDSVQVEEHEAVKHYSRNLSIIPQIQSIIQNSIYEQKQKQKFDNKVKQKKEVTQNLFKILGLVMGQSEFQKAEYEKNLSKILSIYNKLRASTPKNNFYTVKMFEIFTETSNFTSILVLIAETLDYLEQKGLKKILKIPFWMQKYLFFIIQEKGLKFLNDLLEKFNYYDEAVIDAIQLAKKWKIKGITF